MLTIEETIEIPLPPHAVYDYVADSRNAKNFMVGFDRFEPLGSPVAELGARIDATGRLLGVSVHSVFEIVELKPGALIRTRSIEGPAGEALWRFQPNGTGALVKLSMGLESPGRLGAIIQRLVEGAVRQNLRQSLAKLKDALAGDS